MRLNEKHRFTKKRRNAFLSVGLFLIAVSFQMVLTETVSVAASIGSVMAVRKKVRVTHPGDNDVILINRGDGVQFMDLYETQKGARAKLLFEDDSLLTLGGNSKLQITENIFNPSEDIRSTTMNLLSGQVRVLIGKTFSGTGSKFEVHTATAVAAARGTYFIVWVFERAGQWVTGVVGMEGLVDVVNPNISNGLSVLLKPNQFTIISANEPPSIPATIAPNVLIDLLAATDTGSDSQLEAIPSAVIAPAVGMIANIFPEATFEYVPVSTLASGLASGSEGSDSSGLRTKTASGSNNQVPITHVDQVVNIDQIANVATSIQATVVEEVSAGAQSTLVDVTLDFSQ